jgi:hypothetical protein
MSSRFVLALALVAALIVALVVVRIVASDDEPARESECAAAGIERPLPPEFPSSFPLPPGTRVTEAAVSAAGSVLVRGSAPLSAPEAVAFFRSAPARAGWQSTTLDEREGAGVSAAVRGHGLSGTWTVDEVSGCPSTALVTLRFRRP